MRKEKKMETTGKNSIGKISLYLHSKHTWVDGLGRALLDNKLAQIGELLAVFLIAFAVIGIIDNMTWRNRKDLVVKEYC